MATVAALVRCTRAPLRGAPARAASWSCAGETPPPAGPPCRPHPKPLCRPPPPCSEPVAVRVVCCAPPRTRRPPCDPRQPARALTCVDVRSGCPTRCAPTTPAECDPRCGAGVDGVARRLAAALAERRRQYEAEATARLAARCRLPPPPQPYAPGAARSCLPSVDGRTYSLPCSMRPHARCGPCRTPPAPEQLPLSRPACRPSDLPNPCAHRPRVFLEVDRDPPPPPPLPPPAPTSLPTPSPPCGCGPTPQPARGLAERIVAGLRGQAACVKEAESRRRLHTLAPRSAGASGCSGGAAGAAGASELERVLSARSALKEAGRGRASVRCAPPSAAPPAEGRLELPVPAGAKRLCVLVSLAAEEPPTPAPCPPPAAAAAAVAVVGPCGAAVHSRRDSWLSIEAIQRKFSCYRDKPPACPPTPASPSCPQQPSCPSKKPACPPVKPACPPQPNVKPACPPVKPACPPQPNVKPACPPQPNVKPACPPQPHVKPACPPVKPACPPNPSNPKPSPCDDKGSKIKKFTTLLPLLA